jgi:hypothetical protein
MMTPVEVDFVEVQDRLVAAHLVLLEVSRELNRAVVDIAGLHARELHEAIRRCDAIRERLHIAEAAHESALAAMLEVMALLDVERQDLENVLEKRREEDER